MIWQGTCGKTLNRKSDMASSIPTPSRRSVALSTSKLSSSSATRSTSSLMRGHRLEREASASLFWNEVGVEGQSVMGALDQAVAVVFGEMVATGATAAGAINTSGSPLIKGAAKNESGKSLVRPSGNVHKELSFKAGDSSCTAGRRGANASMSSKIPSAARCISGDQSMQRAAHTVGRRELYGGGGNDRSCGLSVSSRKGGEPPIRKRLHEEVLSPMCREGHIVGNVQLHKHSGELTTISGTKVNEN